MPLKNHRLATDMDARYRPFFDLKLVAHLSQLVDEVNKCQDEETCRQNYAMLKNASTLLLEKVKSVYGIEKPGKNTTYAQRVAQIDALTLKTKSYKKGARLLFREINRIMCHTRSETNKSVKRINDPKEAAKLLHEALSILKNTNSDMAKKAATLDLKIQAGCGSSGEIFMETHKVDEAGVEHIDINVYSGILSDLYCAYINAYVTNVEDEKEGDAQLDALIKFFGIHPLNDVPESAFFMSDDEE